MYRISTILVLLIVFSGYSEGYKKYDPSWDSLDNRPLPDWYDKAKIGIFLHWGVYSVPSFGSEWFWWSWQGSKSQSHIDFMNKNYPPGFTYQDFAPQFTAEFYDPDEWADLFQKSGAKYVVLTSKHHEGYTLWPSSYSFSWNAMDVGPKRDILGDLATAVRSKNLTFGLYHSLFEWFNPLYLEDKANGWNTSHFVDYKIIPEMKELLEKYEPDVLWSDGEWEAPAEYWKSLDFLAWLYNESPVKDTIVTNDRWGQSTLCTHGGFFTCTDRFNPGHLMPKKWENAMTVDGQSWGYRRNAQMSDILTPEQLIGEVAQTVSCGGNILINVGPTKEGTIIPIFQERLLQLGEWLGINGEAIYETVPWMVQNDTLTSDVWYTSKGNTVYALVLFWPKDNVLDLGSVVPLFENDKPQVTLLGNEDLELLSTFDGTKVQIEFPNKSAVESCWVYSLKFVPKSKINVNNL